MNHPRQLGKYPITGVIGEGAMGVVYRALDPVIGRTVAIKTLRVGPKAHGTARGFQNEARAVGRLSHPGIVAIYEYGEDGATAYIVMEYIEGRTLGQTLDTIGTPGEAATLRVMDQLLDALDCAHRGGVLHCDIKPGNLIDTPQHQLKVTDFGIARIAGHELTQPATLIGTLGYMAPEQYSGTGVGPVTDVFGAGVLLYRMLSGRLPFRGTPENVLYKLLNEQPRAPSQLAGASCDSRWDAVALKAIARDPQARFASAAEFRAALRGLGGGVGSGSGGGGGGGGGKATTVPVGATLPTPAPMARQSTTPRPATLRPAPTLGDIDTAELARIEAALTEAIGPVARAVVQRTALDVSGIPDLLRRLAEGIDPPSREIFLARIRAAGTRPVTRSDAGTGATTPASSGLWASLRAGLSTAGGRAGGNTSAPADDAITPARVERLQLLLASEVGPIARVIVKRAQAIAHGHADLLRRVADEGANGDRAERDRLLALLKRDL